jgi:hypothetical protein
MRLNVSVQGEAKATLLKYRGAFEKALGDWRDYVIDRSQEYVPKDTSHLMRSLEVEVDDPERKVISYDAGYAAYVELGTASMVAAHGPHDPDHPVRSWEAKNKRGAFDNQMMPFLRPAVYEANHLFEKFVLQRIKNLKP